MEGWLIATMIASVHFSLHLSARHCHCLLRLAAPRPRDSPVSTRCDCCCRCSSSRLVSSPWSSGLVSRSQRSASQCVRARLHSRVPIGSEWSGRGGRGEQTRRVE